MKIAFVYAEKEFTTELLNDLKVKLNDHEIVSWIDNKAARNQDFKAVVVMGKFTCEQKFSLP
jgi:hypothetical protein